MSADDGLVTSFRRASLGLTDLRSIAARRLTLALCAATTLSLCLVVTPAGAFISGKFGLQQRKPVWVRQGPLQYHGGPVIHASDSYAIYWDPDELYNPEWMRLIDGYFQNVGAASGGLGDVFSVNAQYGETGYSNNPTALASTKEKHAANQSTFRGAYTDTEAYPVTKNCHEKPGATFPAVACLTDKQIQTMLTKLVKSGKLPGTTGTPPGAESKSTPAYYVLTPPGVTVCTEELSIASTCSNSAKLEKESKEIKEGKITHNAETGICGYHSWTEPEPTKPIVYAVQPWVAGDAGLFTESEPSADVLACQDNKSLEEPNQIGLSFASYGAGLADVLVGDLANEQANIAVNPLFTGWYQNAPLAAEGGSPEQGDMCQFNFGPPPETPPTPNTKTLAASLSNDGIGAGAYYLHWAFNSSGLLGKGGAGCWEGVDLEPHITAPNPVNVGDVVGLDANESDLTLDAAPLSVRQPNEVTRLAQEGLVLEAQETNLEAKITELETKEAKLATEISELSAQEATLESELPPLAKEEKRVATEEAQLASERKEAEEKHELEKVKEENFAATEKKLTEEHKRVTEKKVADETSLTSDKSRKIADEKEKRVDHERNLLDKEDKEIVEEDKPLSKAEETLAKEDKLIKEREPFLAPIYKWDFGYQESGKEVTEEGEEKASVFHTFPCAKTYTVELTVVDGGGNEAGLPASVTKEIMVDGTPCEEKAGGGSTGPGSGSGGGSGAAPGASTTGSTSGTSSKTSGSGSTSLPGPVASQAAVSHSLSTVLKKGLLINYSVNEQVAGRFEVLLAASIARHIGLHGPLATGLAAGTPPQIVIAKAILITTRGGHSTIKIQFGKVTAARLHRLHKVSLMLRMIVHNASSGSPVTVLSTVVLHG